MPLTAGRLRPLLRVGLPVAELSQVKPLAPVGLNGVKVTFRPQLMLRRITKTNKIKWAR